MSFVLPRNVPKLTFTGSLRALGTKRPKASQPPPLPARKPPRDVYAEEVPTPYMGSRPQMPAARARLDSYGDEDLETVAMSREVVAQGLAAQARPVLPVFHVRSAANPAGPALVVPPGTPRARPSTRAPLMTVFWILASILAAMASYKYAPELLERVEDAVHVLG